MFPVYVPPPEYRVEHYYRSDPHIITLRVVKLLSHGGVSPYRIGTAKDLLAAKEWRQECMAPTGARMDITDWRYNHLL